MQVVFREDSINLTDIEVGDMIVFRTLSDVEVSRLIVRNGGQVSAVNPSYMSIVQTESTIEELINYYNTGGFTIIKHIKSKNLQLREV